MKLLVLLGIIFLVPVYGIFAQAASQLAKPFSRVELMALAAADPRQAHLEWVVTQRGIDFQLSEDYLNALHSFGARDALIEALRKAPARSALVAGSSVSHGSCSPSAPTDANTAKRQSQVLQHLFQAAELRHDQAWPQEEQEFRSALAIEPENSLLHVALARVLWSSHTEPGWDAAIAEDRKAIQLEPDLGVAHLDVALGLAHKHEISGAIAEYREAVRLDPDDALASSQLGQLLEQGGDLDGAIAAFKEAVGRKPDVGLFHDKLADLLEKKGDHDGAIAQAREAIRIGPDNFILHRNLAKMLRNKGDTEEAAQEMQIATDLQAKNLPKRIRVGGAVMSAKLIHQVRPTYPGDANVQGTVRLEAVIGKDGTMQDLKLISGPSILASAAIEAVSKWRYQPTLLSGVPVEVETEIDVNFVRERN